MTKTLHPMLPLFALIGLLAVSAQAQQSNNHVLHAVPVEREVAIDGDLSEWDLSGTMDIFAHFRLRNTYSARVATMYDEDYFYLGIVWRDPTPMFNRIDPINEADRGWRSDCIQLRVQTDVVLHLDAWYSTVAERPVMRIVYGSWRDGLREGSVQHLKPMEDAMTAGAEQAFRKADDGRGYTQEVAIPWKLLTGAAAVVKETGKPYTEGMTFRPGDTFRMGVELLWGGPDGYTWPVHRYADLLLEGTTDRMFFWTAERVWGEVKLMPEGNLDLPEPVIAGLDGYLQRTEGPTAIAYEMPFDGFATIVVEDADGIRVRNLIGMAPRAEGAQIDYWDGADDDGNLVPPGAYRWRGLVHAGIEPVYEASYASAGHMPWETSDGAGAWLSDHNAPFSVAASSNGMVLAAQGGESGYAMIGTDLEGRKRWGQRRFHNLSAVATDGKYAYAGIAGTGSHKPGVGRVELRTGRFTPFKTKPEPQLIVNIDDTNEGTTLCGLAVQGGRLAVALAGADAVRFFDAETFAPLGEVAVPKPGGLAFDAAGNLFAVSDGRIVRVTDKGVTPVVTTGLDTPHGVAIDAEGRFYVSNGGKHQVAVFDRKGKFLRAIGTAGGRRRPGKWDPSGMFAPRGVAVDPKGRLWVAELDLTPKRISVWSADGKLERDFIGPPMYGGMGGFADPLDKTRLFGLGCEWTLDYQANQAEVQAVAFTHTDWFWGTVRRFGEHEYIMSRRDELLLRHGDGYRSVVKFGRTRDKGMQLGDVEIPPNTNYLWTDSNDDGAVQAAEVVTRGGEIGWTTGFWGGHWLDDDFNIGVAASARPRATSETAARIPRIGMTPGGVPLYDVDAVEVFIDREVPPVLFKSPALFVADKDRLIVGVNPLMGVRSDGVVEWTYPDRWSGVHASHRAPMPEHDAMLIGTLACAGVADTGTEIGRIWAMNSNMGRLSIMTTDGLFVAGLFQDDRMGADPWPDDARPGTPLGGVTMGSEWFGGHFFKSEPTGEYYLIAGWSAHNLIRLDGFESLRPLKGAALVFTDAHRREADALVQRRAAEAVAGAARELTISRRADAPAIDGKLDDYPAEAFVEWRSGSYRARAALATDGKDLFWGIEVFGDNNPMVNAGEDAAELFVTGDSVNLELGANPDAPPNRPEPVPGDLRLLISVLQGKPVAMLYRWKVEGAKEPRDFHSPWRHATVDSVERLEDARIHIARHGGRYIVEAAVPLASLGFDPQAGKDYKLDIGVIYSDAAGANRAARVYWANPSTGLTSDIPGEIMAHPNLWGTARIGE